MTDGVLPVPGWSLTEPAYLALLLLLPLALGWRRARGQPTLRLASESGGSLPRSLRSRLAGGTLVLQVLGLGLLTVALARPVHRDPLPLEAEGIDIYLCIDVSSSMAAHDLDARRTRLDVAREAATSFVRQRPQDRIGLIRFARYPDIVCPLTLHHEALLAFLAAIEPVERDGPEDLTGIGTAVARSAQLLQNSRAASKVVILLTDGEENVATADRPEEISPLRAAALCLPLGVRVYSIVAGVGARDADGRTVPLDTTSVRQLAETTAGMFFEARDAAALESVYRSIDALEKVEFKEPRYREEERFLAALVGGVLLLVLGRLLETGPLGPLP